MRVCDVDERVISTTRFGVVGWATILPTEHLAGDRDIFQICFSGTNFKCPASAGITTDRTEIFTRFFNSGTVEH